MPRGKPISVTYSKAGGRKMKKVGDVVEFQRRPYVHLMRKPEPLSELTQFVEDCREELGISTLDCIRGFQREHGHLVKDMKVLARSGHYGNTRTILMCPVDGALRFTGNVSG